MPKPRRPRVLPAKKNKFGQLAWRKTAVLLQSYQFGFARLPILPGMPCELYAELAHARRQKTLPRHTHPHFQPPTVLVKSVGAMRFFFPELPLVRSACSCVRLWLALLCKSRRCWNLHKPNLGSENTQPAIVTQHTTSNDMTGYVENNAVCQLIFRSFTVSLVKVF